MKINHKKEYFYNTISETFDNQMNKYDLNKRLAIVFEKLLKPIEIKGRKFLDLGCGTGWFSKKAAESGAIVFSADIGLNLLKVSAIKCNSKKIVSDAGFLSFKDKTFDYILATELIEHTVDPKKTLREIFRVLKDGGTFVMTVPNNFWHFSISIANILKIRKYEGNENWVGYYQLQRWLKDEGFIVEKIFGFHLFPFVFHFLNPLLNRMDDFSNLYSPVMLNIAVRSKKPE